MFKFLKNLFKKCPPTVHPEEPETIKKENTDDVKDIEKVEHHIIIGSALGNSSNKIIIPDTHSKQPPKIIYPEKQKDNFPSSEKPKIINKGNINTRDIKEVEHHIVIGIDFGSSRSKVVVRDDHSVNRHL